MKARAIASVSLVAGGFIAGMLVSQIPSAFADISQQPDMTSKKFMVSVNEIRQQFVFADEFSKHYVKDVTMSDGSVRHIELTPMIHDGKQLVEFKDSGGMTYMGLNGTTTNSNLMVELRDRETMRAQMQAEGWSFVR